MLVVDDDSFMLRSLQLTMRKFKQPVLLRMASSAAEGLDVLRNHKIDIVISDMNMGAVSGIDMFKQYHADTGSKKVRGYILTGNVTAELSETQALTRL